MSDISVKENEENAETFKSLIKYGKQKIINKSNIKKEDNKDNKEKEKNINLNNTEDALNTILPPKESINTQGQIVMEYVETNPATKLDVLDLQIELDKQLQIKKARETGICPIREDLYSQCFDELIRQITINCTHRGMLLVRIRDEIRMNIDTYQRLYESSWGYGIRLSLESEQKKKKMTKSILILQEDTSDVEKEVEILKQELLDLEQNEIKTKEFEDQQHQERLQEILEENKKSRDHLEKVLLIK